LNGTISIITIYLNFRRRLRRGESNRWYLDMSWNVSWNMSWNVSWNMSARLWIFKCVNSKIGT